MALAKREAARRGLYSKFFRGPILGPEVHSETVETEATAVSQTVGEDIRVGTEKRSKNNDLSRDASTEDSNNEAKKQEKLRKKAEKAAKKLRRRKGKQKGEDEQDVDETIMLSAPQEQVSEVLVLETPHEMPEKRKKKNKRRKVTSTCELQIPPFERTLVVEDCKDSKASRKKRRRRDE
jgi:nucleolar protein TMA23